MTILLSLSGLVAGLVIGWLLGRRGGSDEPDPRDAVREAMEIVAGDLRAGRRPGAGPDAPPGSARVREALEQQWSTRNEEREQALREALGRIAAFLRAEVREPLKKGAAGTPEERRAAMEQAAGALQDMEFFLREPLTPDETHDLKKVVQQVTREFTQDWDISIRFQAPAQPVKAHIHADSFMDAVYLLLHNAGQFGQGKTIDVTVDSRGEDAVVVIRDRGPGFTPEALKKAHDLFFTTTEAGLGLGIPYARKIVESFGGDVVLENADEGGAEVTLELPRA